MKIIELNIAINIILNLMKKCYNYFLTFLKLLKIIIIYLLELVLNQANIARDIGFDLSLGTEWRPWLNNNVIVDVGTNVLFPGEGFKDILTDGNLYSVTSRLIFTY